MAITRTTHAASASLSPCLFLTNCAMPSNAPITAPPANIPAPTPCRVVPTGAAAAASAAPVNAASIVKTVIDKPRGMRTCSPSSSCMALPAPHKKNKVFDAMTAAAPRMTPTPQREKVIQVKPMICPASFTRTALRHVRATSLGGEDFLHARLADARRALSVGPRLKRAKAAVATSTARSAFVAAPAARYSSAPDRDVYATGRILALSTTGRLRGLADNL
mmetsp:Transcript_26789/g.79162  ORF Transcript_26789/g.79162 Transcript_26789/m.79162 type:complete len:220 (+) Transcript_26789:208-867(+)